jgi:hypothetical protein
MKKVLFLVLACAALGASAAQAQVQVIANPSVAASAVTADELKSVFLGAKNALADGSAAEPVLAQAGAAHDAFLTQYVGKSDQALRNSWKSLVFTGKGSMPKSFGTDAEIVAYVAKTKGAIGYVGASSDVGSAKKIAVK